MLKHEGISNAITPMLRHINGKREFHRSRCIVYENPP